MAISERIQERVALFLAKEWLPRIEQRGTTKALIHEAGWSLSSHGFSAIGRLVRASKYEDGGPFPLALVQQAIEVIRDRYPFERIDGIVSVPPNRSGMLVENFARRVAAELNLAYLPVLTKTRMTQEQKYLKNFLQKEDNVKDAFAVRALEPVVGKTLLLIDDVYDSGRMIREVARTLMQAGAQAVYAFTITRTLHQDNQ